MEFLDVVFNPLVLGLSKECEEDTGNYEITIDDGQAIIVEIKTDVGEYHYCIATIDCELRLIDTFGDDIGYTTFDVSRYSLFNPD